MWQTKIHFNKNLFITSDSVATGFLRFQRNAIYTLFLYEGLASFISERERESFFLIILHTQDPSNFNFNPRLEILIIDSWELKNYFFFLNCKQIILVKRKFKTYSFFNSANWNYFIQKKKTFFYQKVKKNKETEWRNNIWRILKKN